MTAGWERFKSTSHGLRIKEVIVDDSGVYTCKGTVHIWMPPFFFYKPRNLIMERCRPLSLPFRFFSLFSLMVITTAAVYASLQLIQPSYLQVSTVSALSRSPLKSSLSVGQKSPFFYGFLYTLCFFSFSFNIEAIRNSLLRS